MICGVKGHIDNTTTRGKSRYCGMMLDGYSLASERIDEHWQASQPKLPVFTVRLASP